MAFEHRAAPGSLLWTRRITSSHMCCNGSCGKRQEHKSPCSTGTYAGASLRCHIVDLKSNNLLCALGVCVCVLLKYYFYLILWVWRIWNRSRSAVVSLFSDFYFFFFFFFGHLPVNGFWCWSSPFTRVYNEGSKNKNSFFKMRAVDGRHKTIKTWKWKKQSTTQCHFYTWN